MLNDRMISPNSSPIGYPQIHTLIKTIIDTRIPLSDPISGFQVLDAAAGNGFLSNWLNDRGVTVTAVDLDPTKWASQNVHCKQVDLNGDLPFEPRTFDLVVSVETIEHLENPFHFLREVFRVLKPGGHMIVSTPNVHSFKSRMKYPILGLPTMFEFVQDDNMGQHISPVSIGTLLYSFDSTGMRLVDLWSVGPPVARVGGLVKSVMNAITLALMTLVKAKGDHACDYYLHRLRKDQMRRLIDDVIMITLAQRPLEDEGDK